MVGDQELIVAFFFLGWGWAETAPLIYILGWGPGGVPMFHGLLIPMWKVPESSEGCACTQDQITLENIPKFLRVFLGHKL